MALIPKTYDALTFCGGGGKGAYQIGVWRALEELGLSRRIRAVAGASIGALNAVLFALGDRESAERIWASVGPKDVLQPLGTPASVKRLFYNVQENFLAGWNAKRILGRVVEAMDIVQEVSVNGLFSRDGLSRILDKIELSRLARSPRAVYITVRNETTGLPEYRHLNPLPVEEQKRLLLATTAIPFVYRQERIDGTAFRDGGWNPDGNNPVGNMPVTPLYDAGFRRILIATLSSPGRDDRARFRAELDALREQMSDAELRALYPTVDLGGMLGMLNFEPKFLEEIRRKGYEDTLKAFKGGGDADV